MNISVQSKTLELTQALRSFVNKQVTKLFRRRERVNGVTVFLETVARKKNDVQGAIAKIKVALPGKDIIVERRASDLYAAIAEVAERASRSVQKIKEKRRLGRRHARLEAEAWRYAG